MKKTIKIVAILLIIAILALIKYKNSDKQGTSQNTIQAKPPIPVTVKVVKPVKLSNTIVSSGTLIANQEVELHSEISGRVIQINFKEGSKVTKGELLIKMYDSDLQAQLKKLKLQEELAAKNELRYKELIAINGISQQEYDNALNQLNTIKADVDLVRTQIEKTEIRAPFSGIIGLRYVNEGSFVTPASKIAALQESDLLKIDFSVPEKYSGIIKNGDSIYFTTENTNTTARGNVYAIEPKIDLSTRTIMLRAICNNKDGKLFPGSFAKINLRTKQNNEALMVPTEAIIPELKGQKVFLVKNGKAESIKVTVGTRTDAAIEITNGIKAGDTIIVTGIMQVTPGAPLKIMQVN